MKQYTKPMISFEEFSLDTPIAGGCDPASIGIANELVELNYFGGNRTCRKVIADETELDQVEVTMFEDNKLCYYTAASMLFTS